ncbi:MAG: hypothetical protein ACR2OG_16930 [Gemmatimonadaceae bacterium]
MRGVKRAVVVTGLIAIALVILAARWFRINWQTVDESYQPSVPHPAFLDRHPRLAIDAAHHNMHRADWLYRPFATLAHRDGFLVESNTQPFSRQSLARFEVLVVVNALGARWPLLPGARSPALTRAECDALDAWVRGGGALLLVADHEPMGAAVRDCAARFGVDMSTGRTVDWVHFDSASGSPAWIDYRRGAGLGEHSIIRGRDSSERVEHVIAFAGQSLMGPPGSAPFLILSDSAFDVSGQAPPRSAFGRSQGVAFRLGPAFAGRHSRVNAGAPTGGASVRGVCCLVVTHPLPP